MRKDDLKKKQVKTQEHSRITNQQPKDQQLLGEVFQKYDQNYEKPPVKLKKKEKKKDEMQEESDITKCMFQKSTQIQLTIRFLDCLTVLSSSVLNDAGILYYILFY